MWGYAVGAVVAIAAYAIYKAGFAPLPQFAARAALKNGDTVQLSASAVTIADADVTPVPLTGPTQFDALRSFVQLGGDPNRLITLDNVVLLGESPGSFDNSQAMGKAREFPFRLRFPRDRVKTIIRGTQVLRF